MKTLTESKITRLINNHRQVRQRVGYLDAQEKSLQFDEVTAKINTDHKQRYS